MRTLRRRFRKYFQDTTRTKPSTFTMSELYDVIVVGAGIVGSATAYHLIKNGAEKVLLLEQVNLPSIVIVLKNTIMCSMDHETESKYKYAVVLSTACYCEDR